MVNKLTAAIMDGMIIVVLYDAEGEAVGFSVDGYVYAYVKNLQGDVIRILDQTGEVLVKYTYDPWGVPTVYGDEDLAALNPCSYRGYYYDRETGYYYLQSRYYNPEMGRFLNADDVSLLNMDKNVLRGNLFNYCRNNPIMYSDPSGYFYISIASMKNILCIIGLNPVPFALLAMGLAKLKSFLVLKLALLLFRLGRFWGPVVQFAFTVVGTIVCIPTIRSFAVAIWDCIVGGKKGIYFGIKYSKWGIPYGFTVYAC